MQARETIMSALFALVSSSAAFASSSRRIKLWGDTPSSDKPALFMYEREDMYTNGKNYLQIVEMNVDLFIYIDAGKDLSATPISVLNNLIDAIEAALKPNPLTQRQTLGGLVSHCYIDGKIMKEPGDLDGDGIAVIPVKILATV